MAYDNIMRAVLGTPWAIQPEKLNAIVEFLQLKVAGNQTEFKAAEHRPRANKKGSIAVIPVYGVISQRMNMMQEFSGGVSTELLGDTIKNAVEDSSIKSIVLDIDSPGGSVYGVQELADIIYQAREQKHITAVANSLAASAAYWLGSAASEFVMTPGGEVGSIGVYMAHTDYSAMDESDGVKTTIIKAGKHKALGNPYEPLSEDDIAILQASVNDYYESFVNAVAKNRGVNASDVRNGFAEGRTALAKEALASNMVDRVATLDEVLAKMGGERKRKQAARMEMI